MQHETLYSELIEKISRYHPSKDFSVIKKAYDIAVKAHEGQLRESGEPYVIHPLCVAIILAELELDRESIIAGILHDVIEDTDYTYNDICNMFSEEVAQIVDGVTKLEKLQFTSKEEAQAENYRKMFLAMAKDIRVILIKVADRLHNVRTLKYRKEIKQREVAQETLDIYVPLAHRLGISKIRYELEDACFKYLYPEQYYDLAEKITYKLSQRTEFVNTIVEALEARLAEEKIEADVEGRPKHFFSIYKKMYSQNKTLDQIYDLIAVRAIVNSIRDCYEVLGVIHEMYKPIPGRFKDYIAMPKSNRYQSLHSTLIGPEGEPFEIQIRTWDMHRTSEYGIAAHWKYKEGKGGQVDPDSEEAKLSWLRQILDWQRELSDNKEYLDALRVDLNVFRDHVYCFTPKGEVIALLNGATPIDFAYAIHSAVGNKTIGARVDSRIVNFDYVLKTGERVEIITSQNSRGPSRDWLKFVKTSSARSKINQWFKKENRDENTVRGRELLEKEAKKKNVVLSQLINDEHLQTVLNKFGYGDYDSLCAAIGHGAVRESSIIGKLIEESDKLLDESGQLTLDETDIATKNRKKRSGIAVKGVGDINVRFSKCCSPVPGDEIIGFVTRGRGVTVHRTDCINVINLDETERNRLIPAEWQLPENASESVFYHAELRIVGNENMGLLMEISRIFNDEKLPVKSINARVVNFESVFDVGIEIKSRNQLDKIIGKIRKIQGITDVKRLTT